MKNSIKKYLAVVLVGMFLPTLLLAEGDPDKDAPLDEIGRASCRERV